MKKIKIYFGPKAEFCKILPEKTLVTTLTQLAIKSDTKRKEYILRVEGQEGNQSDTGIGVEKINCLVAYSDEYAGISEYALQSFTSFISQFTIENLYLQNPPVYIIEQLEKAGENIEIINYHYNSINLDHLKQINNEYTKTILGQDRVKDHLLATLYPSTKLNFLKPIVLLFYGPTGVGKTETAKFISKVIGGNLFRKQFSMYHSEDFASYLFGGKYSQNCFARELLERESNVLLLDEFDKPNSIFHSAFYQLFDEGIFEDRNYRVFVNNSIIICTSNYTSEADIKSKLGEPVFSRFDAIIEFEPLSIEAKEKIIEMQFMVQYDQLSIEERSIIDDVNLKEAVIRISDTLTNVRQIKRIIQDAISSLIIRRLI